MIIGELRHERGGLPTEVRRAAAGRGLFLTGRLEIPSGSVITPFSASDQRSAPHRESLQVDEEHHIDLDPLPLRYVNHCCEPNAFFDVSRRSLVALCAIAPGDELTVFYPATEWLMLAPFACRCARGACIEWVSGAAHLSDELLRRHRLNAHIRRLAARRPR